MGATASKIAAPKFEHPLHYPNNATAVTTGTGVVDEDDGSTNSETPIPPQVVAGGGGGVVMGGNVTKPFKLWTTEELAAVVRARGGSDMYSNYADKIEYEGVDGSLLWHMNEKEFNETLADMNITSRLHARILTHDWKNAIEFNKRKHAAAKIAIQRAKRKQAQAKNGKGTVGGGAAAGSFDSVIDSLIDTDGASGGAGLGPGHSPKKKIGQRGADTIERRRRRCSRCLKHGGPDPENCKGRVGRLGTKACSFFEEDGTPK